MADQEHYDAFISYSHAVDGELAPALQRGLHGLARPWNRLRALRVFRDQTSLSASPNLWSSIETALTGSRFFILLASPESAESAWVRREVDFWRGNRDRATFLIAVTDGTLVWDEAAGDFDWSKTTALGGQPAETLRHRAAVGGPDLGTRYRPTLDAAQPVP